MKGEAPGWLRTLVVASCANGFGELGKYFVGLIPVETGIGDAQTIGEWISRGWILSSFFQKTLEHDPEDAFFPLGELVSDILRDPGLVHMVFLAVGVATVHHDRRLQACLLKGF